MILFTEAEEVIRLFLEHHVLPDSNIFYVRKHGSMTIIMGV